MKPILEPEVLLKNLEAALAKALWTSLEAPRNDDATMRWVASFLRQQCLLMLHDYNICLFPFWIFADKVRQSLQITNDAEQAEAYRRAGLTEISRVDR